MRIDRVWLLGGLGISLLCNVFLVGILIGHGLARPGAPRAAGEGPLVPPAHVRALPADARKAFQVAMAPHRDALKAARLAQKAARLTVETDIAAPTFDRAKVEADLAALRKTAATQLEATHAALLDAVQNLSEEARGALVAHDEADLAGTSKPGHP